MASMKRKCSKIATGFACCDNNVRNPHISYAELVAAEAVDESDRPAMAR